MCLPAERFLNDARYEVGRLELIQELHYFPMDTVSDESQPNSGPRLYTLVCVSRWLALMKREIVHHDAIDFGNSSSFPLSAVPEVAAQGHSAVFTCKHASMVITRIDVGHELVLPHRLPRHM